MNVNGVYNLGIYTNTNAVQVEKKQTKPEEQRNSAAVFSYNDINSDMAITGARLPEITYKPNLKNTAKNNLSTYVWNEKNFSDLVQNREIWTPSKGGTPSLNAVASYFASKRGANEENGYVVLFDDLLYKEYKTNPDFKNELDKHIENNPNTIIYDFRTKKDNSSLNFGMFLREPSSAMKPYISPLHLVNKNGTISDNAENLMNERLEDFIKDEKTLNLVMGFLKDNMIVDTFDTEIQLMHDIKKELDKKGIDIKSPNTYFFVFRDKNNTSKSCDRISYTFATEMGIDNSHLITEAKDIPEGANVVCLDDFAGSGNSLIEFSGIIAETNIKSLTLTPLTSTQGSQKFWNNDGSFKLEELKLLWSETKDNNEKRDEIINELQAAETLTLFQLLKNDNIDENTKNTVKDIIKTSCMKKKLKEAVVDKALNNIDKCGNINYITGRKLPNVFASNYYNNLNSEDKETLLNGLGYSSVISLLGYGKSGTTYVGPVMATNTNVGIMSQISDIFGVKSKDICSGNINGIQFKASDFENFVKNSENTGIFAFQGDLFLGNKNFLEYNQKQYDLEAKIITGQYRYQNEILNLWIEKLPEQKTKVYKINSDGSKGEEIPSNITNMQSISKIKLDAKNKIEALGDVTTNLIYTNGEHQLTIYMNKSGISASSNDDSPVSIHKIKDADNNSKDKSIYQID